MSRKPLVLVVDDEPNGFKVIDAFLKRENYELVYLASGSEALERIDQIEPDVVLLDVMMPVIDGLEVCRQLKSNPIWEHIPIIMVTALSSKEDLAACLAAGADDFISKPVNRVELTARVRSMLRIKQQWDSLKATMHLREEMSGMMVHDLRNPVTTILLGSQFLLMKDILQGNDLDKVQRIYTAGQKLNSMINDLLLMAKMEAGQLALNYTTIPINALVTAVTSEIAEIAATRKLQLEIELPDPDLEIRGDSNLLHRALDNLLSNAIKFSPKESRIWLSVQPVPVQSQPECEAKQVIIQVADEGPGIKPELQQQIFNKYETGAAIAGVSQIGLGLSFCKMVAEAHGGRIYVKNNCPQGARFVLEL